MGTSTVRSLGLGCMLLLGVALAGRALVAEPKPQQTSQMEESKVKRATDVKDRHIGALMALPAVVGAAIGASSKHPGEPAIVLYVSRELKPKERRRIPDVLDGVPIETVVTGPFTARSKTEATPRTGETGNGQKQSGAGEKNQR